MSVFASVTRLRSRVRESWRGIIMLPTSRRGFASMDPERQREIASKGDKSVPAEKRSLSQNRDLAAQAGRKGGSTAVDGQGAH
jgi:uncharacterized protein